MIDGDRAALGQAGRAGEGLGLKLVAEGVLRKDPDSDYHFPNWQMQAHVTRKQIFPAGKTISVEHSYKPIAGGSVGGALTPEYRKDAGMGLYRRAWWIGN